MTIATASPQSISLAEDQTTILAAPRNGSLQIKSADAQGSVRIHWSKGQAVVELEDAQVQISAPDEVSFHCERFCVHADQSIDLHSQGTIRAQATEDMELSARSLALRATLGDLVLRANDFVRAVGEKILLNTDTCPEQSRRQIQSYLARLLGYQPPGDKPCAQDSDRS